jgi:3-oxoacyl-[acyl-carrier-protein] synthase-3
MAQEAARPEPEFVPITIALSTVTQITGKLRMKGKEVFRHAVNNLSSVMGEVLEAASLQASDVAWVVPHQANLRILEATAKKLNISPDQVVVTVDSHANTSAASVPLALDTAVRDGRIQPGDLLLLEAMGGGFTWGAAAVRW